MKPSHIILQHCFFEFQEYIFIHFHYHDSVRKVNAIEYRKRSLLHYHLLHYRLLHCHLATSREIFLSDNANKRKQLQHFFCAICEFWNINARKNLILLSLSLSLSLFLSLSLCAFSLLVNVMHDIQWMEFTLIQMLVCR